MGSVYLAGPIRGLSFDDSEGWRQRAGDALVACGVVVLSPLRHKSYLRGETDLADTYDWHILSQQRSIVTRDRFDVNRADVLLVNLLDARQVSIGTMMELAWADARRIPSVVVMEEEDNVHDHPFVREMTSFRVPTLREGVNVVVAILTEGAVRNPPTQYALAAEVE